MLIDLQLHSNYSDGYLTPTELVKFISERGIKIASLTDHNTVGGLNEFKRTCKKYKIKPITGLELYAKLGNQRLNLLWFNFDEKNPELHKLLRDSQIRRKNQVRNFLKKLVKNGFKLEINKILDKHTHYIPLNKIVDEIWAIPANQKKIKKELKIKNPRESEIIGEYFYGKRNILRESYINVKRIIEIRKKIGGQLIFNHPAKHNQLRRDLMIKLKKLGVDGIEVLSPHHSFGSVMYAQAMARELNFISTGGSDFHRHEKEHYLIQNSWEYFKIDSENLKGVKKIIG
jgi:hypothetical protein